MNVSTSNNVGVPVYSSTHGAIKELAANLGAPVGFTTTQLIKLGLREGGGNVRIHQVAPIESRQIVYIQRELHEQIKGIAKSYGMKQEVVVEMLLGDGLKRMAKDGKLQIEVA